MTRNIDQARLDAGTVGDEHFKQQDLIERKPPNAQMMSPEMTRGRKLQPSHQRIMGLLIDMPLK
ncbi:hypothetical protein D3C76_1191500 [compost metagenome]